MLKGSCYKMTGSRATSNQECLLGLSFTICKMSRMELDYDFFTIVFFFSLVFQVCVQTRYTEAYAIKLSVWRRGRCWWAEFMLEKYLVTFSSLGNSLEISKEQEGRRLEERSNNDVIPRESQRC